MDDNVKAPEMFAFEAEFKDGTKVLVHDLTYSRAIVLAAYKRRMEGACTHKELCVVDGVRRPDQDLQGHQSDEVSL